MGNRRCCSRFLGNLVLQLSLAEVILKDSFVKQHDVNTHRHNRQIIAIQNLQDPREIYKIYAKWGRRILPSACGGIYIEREECESGKLKVGEKRKKLSQAGIPFDRCSSKQHGKASRSTVQRIHYFPANVASLLHVCQRF